MPPTTEPPTTTDDSGHDDDHGTSDHHDIAPDDHHDHGADDVDLEDVGLDPPGRRPRPRRLLVGLLIGRSRRQGREVDWQRSVRPALTAAELARDWSCRRRETTTPSAGPASASRSTRRSRASSGPPQRRPTTQPQHVHALRRRACVAWPSPSRRIT